MKSSSHDDVEVNENYNCGSWSQWCHRCRSICMTGCKHFEGKTERGINNVCREWNRVRRDSTSCFSRTGISPSIFKWEIRRETKPFLERWHKISRKHSQHDVNGLDLIGGILDLSNDNVISAHESRLDYRDRKPSVRARVCNTRRRRIKYNYICLSERVFWLAIFSSIESLWWR